MLTVGNMQHFGSECINKMGLIFLQRVGFQMKITWDFSVIQTDQVLIGYL